MRSARWISGLITVVVAVAALGSMSSTATAAETDHGFSLYAPSLVVLTIADGEQPAHVQRAASVRCLPPGGDHPAAAAACDSLAAVSGDFTAMAPGSGICTKEYRPVTVTASGVWQGKLVSKQAIYGNRCLLQRSTGTLFSF